MIRVSSHHTAEVKIWTLQIFLKQVLVLKYYEWLLKKKSYELIEEAEKKTFVKTEK